MEKTQRKFKSGDLVLIEKKHLHGLAAEVLAYTDQDQYVIARIREAGFEGHLVTFPETDFLSLDHEDVAAQHEINLKRNPQEEEILDVHPTSRLPWRYKD